AATARSFGRSGIQNQAWVPACAGTNGLCQGRDCNLVLCCDPVDLGQVFWRERPTGGAHILLDLLRRGGAGDDARDHAVTQQPIQRQLEERMAAPCGECLELADDTPVAFAGEALRV